MNDNFIETVKQKTDAELGIIAKNHALYSAEERLITLNELVFRNSLIGEFINIKKNLEWAKNLEKKEEEENKIPSHKINFKDLSPQKDYLFTPILIYANIFIFALMILFGMNVFTPSIDTLVQWGGNIRQLTINGQIWRLFTSVFLHGGILHLVFNMYALLYVGSILERVIGKNKFIFAYLISGLAASVSSIMMNENVVSVGASGAIFGLFGVLLPLLIAKIDDLPKISIKNLILNASVFVLYNIMIGFSKSGIDNAAHIGGLFTGLIIGVCYSMIAKEKIRPIFTYTVLLLTLGVFSTLVITNVSDKFGEYDKAMKEFSVNEQKALWMHQENLNLDSIPDNQKSFYVDKFTKEGIDIWEKNIVLLEKLKNNDYDEQVVKLIDMSIDYSIIRQKSCKLMIEFIETNSIETGLKIQEIYIELENKIKEIEVFTNTF